jgi:hypothetical protein
MFYKLQLRGTTPVFTFLVTGIADAVFRVVPRMSFVLSAREIINQSNPMHMYHQLTIS